jgi:hypothetical protein
MVESTSSTTARSPIGRPAARACGGPPNSRHNRARTWARATAIRRSCVVPISSSARHTVVSEATSPNTSP